MSGFFKYVDHCPDVAGSPPDDIMEGDGDCGLELEALFISNNSAEITNAPIEMITVSASEDEPEDLGADFPPSPLQRYLRVLEMKGKMMWMTGRMTWWKGSQREGSSSRGMAKLFP